ncbi:50S ribosomal protein L14e [Candidatus Woesearchaeota archaeon]|nr:50S ribosomal protein L14e [Candidatus Woesearchaeota archaeon]
MMEVGRVCTKVAGRDAGARCVIVDVIDAHYVLVDGATRRRKCNMIHLEPSQEMLDLKKGASHEIVVEAFEKRGWPVMSTKPHETPKRPVHVRKAKPKAEKPAKAAPTEVEKSKAEPNEMTK